MRHHELPVTADERRFTALVARYPDQLTPAESREFDTVCRRLQEEEDEMMGLGYQAYGDY